MTPYAVTRREFRALRTLTPMLGVRWWRFTAAVILGVLGLSASIALIATSAWLIARASQHPPVLYLQVATVGVRFFGISKAVLRYLQRLASHRVAMDGIAHLRDSVYHRLAASRTDVIAGLHRGDLLARVGADVDAIGDLLVKSVLPAFVAAVTAVATVGGIALISPAAAGVLALCLVLSGIVAPLLTMRSARMAEIAHERARIDLSTHAMTLVDHCDELSVAGATPRLHRALDATEDALARAEDAVARPAAFAVAVDALAMGIAVIGAIIIGGHGVESGAVVAIALAVLALTPLASFEGTSELAPAAVQLVKSARAAERIATLLGDADLTVDTRDDARDDSVATGNETTSGKSCATSHVSARNLSVAWPNGPTVVSGIDLNVRPGRAIAIVGPSGIGKSTLLTTLCGMLPPMSGTAIIDGRAAHTWSRREAGMRCALTAEDAHVFATSVIENLRCTDPDLSVDHARALLERVHLGQWLDHLPDGINTVLGSGGTTISGGERRRLLIARALASPAPILLIDEPGEHLDQETGDAIVRDLLSLARPTREDDIARGIVVVTHRLTPIKNADEILILMPGDTDGRGAGHTPAIIGARGTHRELLATCAHYRQLLALENDTDMTAPVDTTAADSQDMEYE